MRTSSLTSGVWSHFIYFSFSFPFFPVSANLTFLSLRRPARQALLLGEVLKQLLKKIFFGWKGGESFLEQGVKLILNFGFVVNLK